MQEHIERALAQGMSDYIVKPYSKNALLERIGIFLNTSLLPASS